MRHDIKLIPAIPLPAQILLVNLKASCPVDFAHSFLLAEWVYKFITCPLFSQRIQLFIPLEDRKRLTPLYLYHMALFHDIGKLISHIPQNVNSNDLEDVEKKKLRECIEKHPQNGIQLLTQTLTVPSAQDWVGSVYNAILYHHERWDGKGYPNHLKQYEIPLEARLLSLFDVFFGMTEPRLYRQSYSIDYALDELKNLSGNAFDPFLAPLVISFLDQSKEKVTSSIYYKLTYPPHYFRME